MLEQLHFIYYCYYYYNFQHTLTQGVYDCNGIQSESKATAFSLWRTVDN